MPLIGALSNQHDVLVRLTELRARLLSQADRFGPSVSQRRPRAGSVQRAVFQVLAKAEDSMRVGEIQAAVERLLDMQVSKDSVNSCLSTGARGKGGRFERVARGTYRLKKPAAG